MKLKSQAEGNQKESGIVIVDGHWIDDPSHIFTVLVSLGEWDGVEDAKDEKIFFYTDGAPLEVGDIIAEDFVVTKIDSQHVKGETA